MTKYPKIILLRHGQTQWNREKRYQGQLNSDLTQKGKQQAKENGQKVLKILEGINDFKFFSSPLGRAKDTSYIIDDNKIIFDDRLKEINFGIFEGKTVEFCQTHYSNIFQEREDNKWHYQIEKGESYKLVEVRVQSWLDELQSDEIIILVAHEMLNRVVRKLYLNLSAKSASQLRQPNDEVVVLE